MEEEEEEDMSSHGNRWCSLKQDKEEYLTDDSRSNSKLSRLSISMFMSKLSIDSFSDEEEGKELITDANLSSVHDSDTDHVEWDGFHSLPATSPRRRRNPDLGVVGLGNQQVFKEYASENEAHEKRPRSRRMKRNAKEIMGWAESVPNCEEEMDDDDDAESVPNSEKEIQVVVITRAKGGKRSLRMGMEEVKACRDLGLELEHQEEPSLFGLGTSGGGGACSSGDDGGTSPISTWRISSPGS